MKSHKTLLLVRSGYPAKEFVLKKLKELGYYLICLDTEKSCPDGLVDEWIITDLSNYDAAVQAIELFLQENQIKIDGVLTFWEEVTPLVAKITDKLGLIGIPYKVVEMIKNKYSFREFCHKNGILSPKQRLLTGSTEDYQEIERSLTFPVVVKPIYGACSAFVVKVDSIEELKNAYVDINKYINDFWLTPEWINTDLFVEEYLDGQEVDIDLLIQDGEIRFWSISDNFQSNEPYFVETGQAIPTTLPEKKQQELIEMAKNTLKKAEVKNGCIHFEAKYSSRGAVPIEINLRMGGDEVYKFVKEAWGVDLVEYAALIAIGENFTIEKPKNPKKYLEGFYFLPANSGKLSFVNITPEIHKKDYLEQLFFFKEVGSQVLVPPQDFDYLGWITVSGASSEQARKNIQEALSLIEYSVS